jgi:hypothetical protein
MDIENRIIKLGLKINQLPQTLEKVALENLRNARLNLTLDYLEENDPEFVKLWNLNMDLLENDKLLFHVKYEKSKPFRSYSDIFYGNIDLKCNLNFEKKEKKIVLIPTVKHRFPSKLTGIIDGIGRSELQIVSKEVTLTGRKIPKSYSGGISRKGTLTMDLEKTDRDPFGADEIWKISCNLFKNNPKNGEFFISNRNKIFDKVKNTWKTIENEQNSLS